ncbi:MAG TPA: CHASE3 domain-containing protein [Steroidobacteraceae bacterium]|nr:CHASE3 domain-containing protein [Steroidobacteraceae bacterium]
MLRPTRRGRYLPIWVFGLTLVVLVGGALTGYLNARRLIGNERLVAHSDDALVDLAGLLSALHDAERSQRGYLLTGSATHLQRYRDAAQRIQKEIADLRRESTDAGQRERLETLEGQIGRKLAELEQTISLAQAGDRAAALAIVRGGASNALMGDIRARVAAMRTAESAFLDRRAGESERSSRLTVAAIVAPTLIGAALLGLLFFLSNRRMIELEAADRHKDEFLAMLAHELRGPLAPLCNGLELVKRSDGSEELRARTCALMERQLELLVRLVEDLLDASRIARGKIELRVARIDLGALLREILEGKRPLIAAAHLELETSLPALPLFVDGDPMRLTQVFRNLLENARKYTEPGGRIAVSLAPEGLQAVVRVKDNGLGIPLDKLEAIFEMFMQINRSAARSQGGLGIGLGLARRLLVLHGGSIEVASEGPGHGSEFVVRLPLATQGRDRVSGATSPLNNPSAAAT